MMTGSDQLILIACEFDQEIHSKRFRSSESFWKCWHFSRPTATMCRLCPSQGINNNWFHATPKKRRRKGIIKSWRTLCPCPGGRERNLFSQIKSEGWNQATHSTIRIRNENVDNGRACSEWRRKEKRRRKNEEVEKRMEFSLTRSLLPSSVILHQGRKALRVCGKAWKKLESSLRRKREKGLALLYYYWKIPLFEIIKTNELVWHSQFTCLSLPSIPRLGATSKRISMDVKWIRKGPEKAFSADDSDADCHREGSDSSCSLKVKFTGKSRGMKTFFSRINHPGGLSHTSATLRWYTGKEKECLQSQVAFTFA